MYRMLCYVSSLQMQEGGVYVYKKNLLQHKIAPSWQNLPWKKPHQIVKCHCASQMCEESTFQKHNFHQSDISLSMKFTIAVMHVHLFFLFSVMDVGGRHRQELRSPKRHSYNIRPFWINAIQDFWETFHTAAWNVWSKSIKWRRASFTLHLVKD